MSISFLFDVLRGLWYLFLLELILLLIVWLPSLSETEAGRGLVSGISYGVGACMALHIGYLLIKRFNRKYIRPWWMSKARALIRRNRYGR